MGPWSQSFHDNFKKFDTFCGKNPQIYILYHKTLFQFEK